MKFFLALSLFGFFLIAQADAIRYGAEKMTGNDRVEKIRRPGLSGDYGLALKPGVKGPGKDFRPEVSLSIDLPEAGLYVISTRAMTDAEGAELMKKSKRKEESLFITLQIGDRRPTRRVAFTPWTRARLHHSGLGIFELPAGKQDLKIALPRGLILDSVEITPFVPPPVPAAAAAYRTPLRPPATHPRIFVTEASLPQVRANLERGENQAVWQALSQRARTPYEYPFDRNSDTEIDRVYSLQIAAQEKAFYYLMTGDETVGREAVEMILAYLPRVEFGNILDVTRPLGRAIYAGSVVYDYCHSLLTPAERRVIQQHLMRLAFSMECGYPPFKQSIVKGHGNEMQINRDLLAMGLALYDEDPLPYQYCLYKILEELVPMRALEYQSPRHSQGINYTSYRFACEMHAVWMLRRLAGREVFDPNIKKVAHYFLHMRLPDGGMLRDGDGVHPGGDGKRWSADQVMFLCYTYAADPVLKAEFQRQGGLGKRDYAELFLLLNDPELPVEPAYDALPPVCDFGPILGSMAARTGWNMGDDSDDVVVEIKGGGYNVGDHQHADAGAFQIYYRGILAGDIGTYGFYGTPYDFGFNKRSIAHSTMLVYDPDEPTYRHSANDGGSRYFQAGPETAEELKHNPLYRSGQVRFCDFGPDSRKPDYSVFSCDIADAYSEKVSDFVRTFCFLDLHRRDVPAIIILADDLTSSRADFKKYWQINTLHAPEIRDGDVILRSETGGRSGRGHVRMLKPARTERTAELKSGAEALNVFGTQLEIPARSGDLPETRGHRVMISPDKAAARDQFLTVIQITDDDAETLPVDWRENEAGFTVRVADRIVFLGKGNEPTGAPLEFDVPSDRDYQLLLCGLAAGKWRISSGDAAVNEIVEAAPGRHTVCFRAKGGRYAVTPL